MFEGQLAQLQSCPCPVLIDGQTCLVTDGNKTYVPALLPSCCTPRQFKYCAGDSCTQQQPHANSPASSCLAITYTPNPSSIATAVQSCTAKSPTNTGYSLAVQPYLLRGLPAHRALCQAGHAVPAVHVSAAHKGLLNIPAETHPALPVAAGCFQLRLLPGSFLTQLSNSSRRLQQHWATCIVDTSACATCQHNACGSNKDGMGAGCGQVRVAMRKDTLYRGRQPSVLPTSCNAPGKGCSPEP